MYSIGLVCDEKQYWHTIEKNLFYVAIFANIVHKDWESEKNSWLIRLTTVFQTD